MMFASKVNIHMYVCILYFRLQEKYQELHQELERLKSHHQGIGSAGGQAFPPQSPGDTSVATASTHQQQLERLKEALRRLQLVHTSDASEHQARVRELEADRAGWEQRAVQAELQAEKNDQLVIQLVEARAQIDELSEVSTRLNINCNVLYVTS